MTPQAAAAMQATKGAVPIRQSSSDLVQNIYDTIARRAFELFDGQGRWHGRDWEDWFRAEAEVLHPVPLELTETSDEFTVRAEVPGFTAKDLDIRVEPNRVSIAGRRESREEETKGKRLRAELRSNHILRIIELPIHADTSHARATLKDGILTIDLPKAEYTKPVRVEVRGS